MFICNCCDNLEDRCGTSTKKRVEKSLGLFGVLLEFCVKEFRVKILMVTSSGP